MKEPGIGNVEVADLDADGWLDLVLLRPYSRDDGVDRADSWIKIYHGNDRGLETEPRFEFPTVGAIDVVAADLNGTIASIWPSPNTSPAATGSFRSCSSGTTSKRDFRGGAAPTCRASPLRL